MRARRLTTTGVGLAALAATLWAVPATAAGSPSDHARDVATYWSSARMDAAVPRDLVLDEQGRGYVRGAGGRLVATGARDASLAEPRGKPSGTPGGGNGGGGGGTGDGGGTGEGDSGASVSADGGPDVTMLTPSQDAHIGSSETFAATITDDDGIKSVQFLVSVPAGSAPQTFTPTRSGDEWTITLQGFSGVGTASWYVVAKDGAKRGGDTTQTDPVTFGYDAKAPVANAEWTAGGAVQTAAGRIYFRMRDGQGQLGGYVCSGTVVDDTAAERSLVLTAAHCVYDDVNKEFAQDVLFIPNQADTTGARTDTDCSNDPFGCWAPSSGVVDVNWTTRTFPDNVAWDYAYYVVPDDGAHVGDPNVAEGLAEAVGDMAQSFEPPTLTYTYALGYSYSDDPNFMYCAEGMTTNGAANWWLGSCDLSGGSSGGPWVQPMDTTNGSGSVISVNSWGYTTRAGMAGPKLSDTSATCVFDLAETAELTSSSRGHVSGSCQA